MKIAILGGSFDPPHLGHLLVVYQVKDILKMDEVWLMPCNKHPFNKSLHRLAHRYRMTQLLKNDFIKVSDFEVKSNKTSYSINTLQYFTKKRPRDKFFWVLGSDQLKVFHLWRRWQKLTKKHNLVIFPREAVLSQLKDEVKKYFQLKTITKNITVFDSENLALTNISSSMIREKVKKGLSIKYLVPPKIENYIIENNLYQK